MIYSVLDWHFFLQFFVFFVAIFFSVIVPGYCVSKKILHVDSTESVVFSFAIGLALLGWQGYIFGYLQLRNFLFLYLILCICLVVWKRWIYNDFLHDLAKTLSQLDTWIKLMIVVGVLLQLLTIVTSGFQTAEGVRYIQINADDGLFHVSLITSIMDHFPPQQPGASGLPITNYHYWEDMILAEMARGFGLSPNHLYFQFFPLLLAPFLGVAIAILAKKWFSSVTASRWIVFFHFFAGDVTYIFMLLLHRVFTFAPISLDNGIIQLTNMPQAVAKVMLFAGLLGLLKYSKKPNLILGVTVSVLFATMTGLKVYFAFAGALGLGVVWIIRSIQLMTSFVGFYGSPSVVFKEWIRWSVMTVVFIVLSFIIFWPVNSEAGGLMLIWSAWPRLLISPEKMNWNDWWLRMQVYQEAHNIKALFVFIALANAIFLISFYGIKLFGLLFLLPQLIKKQSLIWLFCFPQILILMFLGMHTLQVSGGYNTFNFTIVALTLLTFFTGGLLAELSKYLPQKLNVFCALLIISFTIPRVVSLTIEFIDSTFTTSKSSLITVSHQEALRYLSELPADMVVQSNLGNGLNGQTPYIYAYTHHFSYLGGMNILESHNQPIAERKYEVKALFSGEFGNNAIPFMNEHHIGALFIDTRTDIRFGEAEDNQVMNDTNLLQRQFFNDQYAILTLADNKYQRTHLWCGPK
ncbi:MAG: hypothetical protein ABI425_01080 [Patescibacteria group bacterium]